MALMGCGLTTKEERVPQRAEQREEVLSCLPTKDWWELSELEYKLAEDYDVIYESKQSYYNLFETAGISWKKTTCVESQS